MIPFNQDQKNKIKSLLRTEEGKSLLADLKAIIVKEDNYPANASDGMLFALLSGRKEGELSVLRQIIRIGESND